MLRSLVQFEWRYQVKQVSFIVLTIAFFGYGAVVTADELGVGMALLNHNAPYKLNFFIALSTVLGVLATMLFCVQSVLRDKEYQMDGITSTLAARQQFISRFIVVFVAVLALLSVLLLGLYLGLFAPDLDNTKIANSHISHYLWPWFLFSMPNAFIVTTLLFVITAKWQNAMLTYLAGVALFAVFWLSVGFIGAPVFSTPVMAAPEIVGIFALLDPFGTSAFFEQTSHWTPQQKNQYLIAFDGNLFYNRLLWLSFTLFIVLRCEKSLLPKSKKQAKSAVEEQPTDEVELSWVKTQNNRLSCLISMAGFEIKQLTNNWPFRIALLLWGALVIVGIIMVVNGNGSISGRYPTTSLLISYCAEGLPGLGLFLIIFYSAQSLWQERLLKVDTLLDSNPVTNSTRYMAKLLSLFFIVVALITLLIVLAISYQIGSGYYRIELAHYLSMYYFFALPLFVQTVFIVFIQTLLARTPVANKYLGMVVSGLLVLMLSKLMPTLGFEHPMLQFNQFPSMLRNHTELTGYGQYATKFHWFAALWTFIAVVIAIFTVHSWHRIESQKSLNTITVFIVVAVTGGAMFYQIDHQSSDENLNNRAAYERKYKQYQTLSAPQIRSTKTVVDIFPNQQRYQVKAANRLINTSNKAIHKIFVSSRTALAQINISSAKLTRQDSTKQWHVYLFELQQPLLPGNTTLMSYRLEQSSTPFAINNTITSNGSYFTQRQIEPVLGYMSRLEIKSSNERKRHGLPAKTEGDEGKFITQKRHFESIISTAADQTAVTSGKLVKQWKKAGRAYFHYKMAQTIYPGMSYFSARYQLQSTNYKGVPIQMYFHLGHQTNIDEMIKATKATIDYAEQHLGSYPYSSLRILEVPGYTRFGGRASAGIVAMNETSMYTLDTSNPNVVNTVVRRTIHEVAHQWWGEKLAPKITKGADIIIESLAKYVEIEVLDKLHGSAMTRALGKLNQRRYFSGRSYRRTPEVPLTLTEDQNYLSYGKGAVTMQALKQLLGEAKFNQALRSFMKAHHTLMNATTADLVNELKAVSTQQQQRLIDDWLNLIIEYDLAASNATVTLTPDGRYRVEFDLTAKRLAADEHGEYLPIAIDEPIQIGLFEQHPDTNTEQSLLLISQLVTSEHQRVSLIVDKKPLFVVVDPFLTRLDADVGDNVVAVEVD